MNEYIKTLVSRGNAVITEKTKRTPSKFTSDGAIMGNGDIGAVIRTETNGFSFLMGKNDFWRLPYAGETKEQRYDRLIKHQNMRRTGARILPAGWMTVSFEGMNDNEFKTMQTIYEAVTDTEVYFEDGTLCMRSWVCAVQNTLILELSNNTVHDINTTFTIMPGMYKNSGEQSYEDGCTESCVWFTYGANIGSLGGRRVAAVASAETDVTYMPQNYTEKGGKFVLKSGESTKIFLTLLSDLDGENPLKTAKELNGGINVNRLFKDHKKWWEDFWAKSTVETGDKLLDKLYYFSLYGLGCAIRDGKVTPAMYGPWTTDDLAPWSGAYTMNYNYQSPFFCLYSSNRTKIAEAYIDTTVDMIEIGELYAKTNYGHRGIIIPVEMGPWGTVCSTVFFHQKSNAAYACVNLFMHYFSTLDREIGMRAYPFIKKCAEFWEDDLVYENGKYNLVGDAAHEEYYEEGERNNTHGLGLVKMLFSGIVKMSRELDIDADLRGKWQEIAENLPDFPTFERNGETVIRYNEDSYAWRDMNATPIKFIYPFGCVGLGSDKKLLEIARNTVEQKEYLFDNSNAICEYTAIRSRVGCDAERTYNELINVCKKYTMPNSWIFHGGEGIECFNVVPGGINEMMLQSFEDIIRVFPAWPKGRNAKFENLRAYGAFLVSSEIKDDEVEYIRILSEKGKKLCLQLPWDEKKIVEKDTKPGELIEIRREK